MLDYMILFDIIHLSAVPNALMLYLSQTALTFRSATITALCQQLLLHTSIIPTAFAASYPHSFLQPHIF